MTKNTNVKIQGEHAVPGKVTHNGKVVKTEQKYTCGKLKSGSKK